MLRSNYVNIFQIDVIFLEFYQTVLFKRKKKNNGSSRVYTIIVCDIVREV
jgi:hypothetical protein